MVSTTVLTLWGNGREGKFVPHDIRDLRIEVSESGRMVVVCKCGWRSASHDRATHAQAEWEDDHRATG